jgi:hypothetical protein
MIIDFSNAELNLIFEILDDRRISSDDEDEINLINSIHEKMYQQKGE